MRPVVPCGSNTSHRHQHRPQVLLGHGTRHDLQQQLGPRGRPGSRWQHSPLRSIWPPGCSMTLGHHHGLRRLTRYRVSTGPSVATGAMEVNSYPGGCRVTNSDMDLDNSLGPDDNMCSVSTRHSDLHGTQTPARPQVAAQTPGFHVAFDHQPILFRQLFY